MGVDIKVLEAVKKILYIGSTLNHHTTLNNAINLDLQKFPEAFKTLDSRIWLQYGMPFISVRLYSYETLVRYHKDIKQFEIFHQCYLMKILNVYW